MKEKELKLIRELILNSKRSDRDLAKEIQTTQPTIGRIRKKIEKEGYISEYSAFPDLSKLNIKLIAFISIKWNDYNKTDKIKDMNFLIYNVDQVSKNIYNHYSNIYDKLYDSTF